jgi:hypothetical protein
MHVNYGFTFLQYGTCLLDLDRNPSFVLRQLSVVPMITALRRGVHMPPSLSEKTSPPVQGKSGCGSVNLIVGGGKLCVRL